ncbi:MAG: TRAP transporter small permease [Rubrivivax sp.]|jgi:TRAP-type C4-dicarboxylate transport system permease small subunit|nr:TRAP transporter small permease [Rubrivivax sp.]
MATLRRLNEQLTRLLLVLAAVLAFLLCFLVVADVVGRVGFDRPVKGTTEIVSLSIVIICYLQTGFAIRSGGMLHVDMFVSRAGPRGQSLLAAVAALAGLVFFGLICWGSFEGAAHAWNSNEFEGEGALRVPVWPARFVLILGTAIAAFNYALLLVQHLLSAAQGTAPQATGTAH